MSLLTVCQGVAKRVGLEVPAAVAAATDDTEVRLMECVIEAGEKIADAHAWQALTTLKTMTGDGAATAFDIPDDFDRMTSDQHVWSSRLKDWFPALSHDDWLDYETRAVQVSFGVYTKLGNQILIKPTMETGETASYYYQTNQIWTQDAVGVEEPSDDGATFKLDERLLKLCAVWVWKSHKELPFEQHYMEYHKALGHAKQRDRGPRTVRFGERPRMEGRAAFPWTVTEA